MNFEIFLENCLAFTGRIKPNINKIAYSSEYSNLADAESDTDGRVTILIFIFIGIILLAVVFMAYLRRKHKKQQSNKIEITKEDKIKTEIKYDNSIFQKELVYLNEEYSFYTLDHPVELPNHNYILIDRLDMNFLNDECVSLDGYLPLSSCIKTELTIKDDYTQGKLFISDLSEEIANELNSSEPMSYKNFPTYFDEEKGIVCIGDKDAKPTRMIEIYRNCIVSLGKNGELLSFYINVVQMSNKAMNKVDKQLLIAAIGQLIASIDITVDKCESYIKQSQMPVERICGLNYAPKYDFLKWVDFMDQLKITSFALSAMQRSIKNERVEDAVSNTIERILRFSVDSWCFEDKIKADVWMLIDKYQRFMQGLD